MEELKPKEFDSVISLKIDTIDSILLNLKMISLIKPQDKLYLEDGLLKIDIPAMMQGIVRWINDYSRLKTMDDIEGLINATQSFVENNLKKQERSEEDNRECQKILVEVSKSIIGIQNLKYLIFFLKIYDRICYH